MILRTDAWVDFDRVPANPDRVRLNYPGGSMEMDGSVMMPLIWDGLLTAGESVRKWNEPHPEFPDSLDIVTTDFFTIYDRLSHSNEIKMVDCGTPWFDWGE
jgi:hypothetical protein